MKTPRVALRKETASPPPTRADCIAAVRPCPHVQCRHHIWNDTKAVPLPRQTCALDAAADGPLTLEEIGDLLGLTRERIRQIQVGVEAKHAVWSSLRVFHEA